MFSILYHSFLVKAVGAGEGLGQAIFKVRLHLNFAIHVLRCDVNSERSVLRDGTFQRGTTRRLNTTTTLGFGTQTFIGAYWFSQVLCVQGQRGHLLDAAELSSTFAARVGFLATIGTKQATNLAIFVIVLVSHHSTSRQGLGSGACQLASDTEALVLALAAHNDIVKIKGLVHASQGTKQKRTGADASGRREGHVIACVLQYVCSDFWWSVVFWLACLFDCADSIVMRQGKTIPTLYV